MADTKKTIENILIERSIITQEHLDKILEDSRKKGIPFEKLLVQSGAVSEEAYAIALSEQLDIPYVDLKNYLVDTEIIRLIPEDLAKKYKVLPIFKIGNTLTIATSNPKYIVAIDELLRVTKCEIEQVLSSESSILSAIDRYYGREESIENIIKGIEVEKQPAIGADLEKLAAMAGEAPIVKLVSYLITLAVKDKASDIHIEPQEDSLNIRFRIDGVLQEVFTPPKHLQSALLSRVKILAKMDISEKRRPQDGRFNVQMENRDIDLRVSAFPTIYGENVVIRILDRASVFLELEKLGFLDGAEKKFEKLIVYPYGIILVTGPTGCGKTTTLYSALSRINSEEKNIITIEDPVEYHLGKIRQSQINPKAGLTFATGLRSILRQDPDVIMVGEIRDIETAEISVQAALTGHLVLSTLHTNDAPAALTRLIDMGVEPYQISSSVIGVLAQRLVRRICENCKEEYILGDGMSGNNDLTGKKVFRGKGCNACKNLGYKGRIGIFELLVIDDSIKNLIINKVSSDEIKKKAVEKGMKTLRDDGLDKVLKGITTIEEVNKATQ